MPLKILCDLRSYLKKKCKLNPQQERKSFNRLQLGGKKVEVKQQQKIEASREKKLEKYVEKTHSFLLVKQKNLPSFFQIHCFHNC